MFSVEKTSVVDVVAAVNVNILKHVRRGLLRFKPRLVDDMP